MTELPKCKLCGSEPESYLFDDMAERFRCSYPLCDMWIYMQVWQWIKLMGNEELAKEHSKRMEAVKKLGELQEAHNSLKEDYDNLMTKYNLRA